LTGDVSEGLFQITGKTALVTGGVRGLGHMCAAALLRHGARVIVTTRRRERASDALAELSAIGSCELIVADLSTPDGPAALGEAVRERLDALDILVNNAGITWGAPFRDYPADAWTRVLGLNVAAPFGLVQATLDLLEEAGRRDGPARVINIGSVDGHAVGPFDNWAYPPSKAALHQLTRVLACRLGPRRITVNCLAPGTVRTKMTAELLDHAEAPIVAATPLGRIATAADLEGALVYLTSRAGEFVTGTVLGIDGGASLARWGGEAIA
jgi:NAD(P)-dependent dehydrogenase (short-subunit alcohol dehydrogenase family)